jgi:hypothetical protein
MTAGLALEGATVTDLLGVDAERAAARALHDATNGPVAIRPSHPDLLLLRWGGSVGVRVLRGGLPSRGLIPCRLIRRRQGRWRRARL